MASRKNWGAIRKLPSKRFQASYIGPDGRRHTAPDTFKTKTEASGWLAAMRTDIKDGNWLPEEELAPEQETVEVSETPFKDYALQHIEIQTNSKGELLRESTKALYRRTLRTNLKPFLNQTVESITKPQVSAWYAKLIASGKKTSASKAYKLLSAVLKRAVEEGKIAKNPCGIRGAHSAATGKAVDIPTADEVAAIANAISPEFKTLVLVAAYGGFRFGELTELRRKDVFPVEKAGQVSYEFRVRRAVTYVAGAYVIDKPKSEKSSRDVPLSPALTSAINDHLFNVVPEEEESLLFPSSSGGHLPHYVFIKAWNKALKKAGISREGITPHSLRHFAGTPTTNIELVVHRRFHGMANVQLLEQIGYKRFQPTSPRWSREFIGRPSPEIVANYLFAGIKFLVDFRPNLGFKLAVEDGSFRQIFENTLSKHNAWGMPLTGDLMFLNT